jgi:hypothetical protein
VKIFARHRGVEAAQTDENVLIAQPALRAEPADNLGADPQRSQHLHTVRSVSERQVAEYAQAPGAPVLFQLFAAEEQHELCKLGLLALRKELAPSRVKGCWLTAHKIGRPLKVGNTSKPGLQDSKQRRRSGWSNAFSIRSSGLTSSSFPAEVESGL